jgi:hypothetical protein
MTHDNVKQLSDSELVARFAKVCMEQDRALLYSDVQTFNQLYAQMASIRDELRSRSGDQRRALVSLYDHPNAQVRLQAARASLAVAPKEGRLVIEQIATSRKYPQAGDAGMTLFNLDRGIFKPS